MSGMWSRWAARRRLAGLAFLGGAAVAIAIAVLMYTIALAPLVGALIASAVVLIVHAGFEFYDAARFARLGR